ncbi:MAG TPA: LuxR C-terminal-related transcriptional regulator [Pseudonocardia sp.]|nr:LuxR C-terminal-related transcriptional regulator [Pseudonocardia sp.]
MTVADSVRQRLDVLGEPARTVLVAGAVLGRRFDPGLLPAVTELEPQAVLAALRLGVDAQLLDQDGTGTDGFRFRHALTREALLDRVLAVERAALARRALRALEERAATEGDGAAAPLVPAELAADLAAQAGEHRRAARLLVGSARRALDAGALATALAGAVRARELAEDDAVIAADADELQVEAAALAGDTDRAARVGARLLDGLSAAPSRRAAVHVRLARAAVTAADWAGARAHVEVARRLAGAGAEPAAARLDVLASTIALGNYDVDEAARYAERALSAAEDHAPADLACEALELLGRCTRLRDLDQAEAYFGRALAIAQDAGLALWRARALHELSTIDMARLGPVDRAVAARTAAEQVGALGLVAVIDLHLMVMHTEGFRLDAALVAGDRAERAARRFGLPLVAAGVTNTLASVHVLRGDLAQAKVLAARAGELAAGVPEFEAAVKAMGFGVAHLAGEDRPRARSELAEAVALVPEHSDIGRSQLWGLYLLAHLGIERREPPAPARVSRINAGCLALSDAVISGAGGDRDGALAAFVRGDTLLAPAPWNRQLARRLVAEHAVTDGWGAPVEWLRGAAAFFTASGNDALVRACRSLLRRAGVVVRRGRGEHTVPAALAGLGVTSRELDVLALVADGLSNRDIGARLYLSPRTVEKHVERLLAKTGSTSRAQLAALAARTTR